jgi:N-acetylmuramoyl-L-alanine amidase
VYVPAVLRNTAVPTKILIEMANMNNPTDCSRLADPEWRETFAEAYVDALKAYFGS